MIDFSKNGSIRSLDELTLHFRELLDEEPELRWTVPAAGDLSAPLNLLEFRLDDRTIRFRPQYSLQPSEKEVEAIRSKWTPDDELPLLVVPELSQRVLGFCRTHGLATIDLNGRVYIRAPNLLIDRRPLPGRQFRYEREPRNIFVGKSVRIVRALLTDRTREWTQAELLPRTKASPGLVSRIVQHLVSQGYAEKTSARTFRLSDFQGLIDAWIKSDELKRRSALARFSLFEESPLTVAGTLQEWANRESVPIAFTQWVAGVLRHPYTEPIITSAYVQRLPDKATLQQLGFRSVADVGKVWLYIPDDEGVFLETQQLNGLELASDAQIVVDLQGTGLRGPDQATALRQWEGFCLP
jgi:hypothetical protein